MPISIFGDPEKLMEKAKPLGFEPVRIGDLTATDTGYLGLGMDVPDPFLGIHEIIERAGRYRVVCGRIEPFMVSGDFIVWRRAA